MTFDKQEASLKQATDLVLDRFAFAGQAPRDLIFGPGTPAFQLGFGLDQTLTLSRHSAKDALSEFFEDMELSNPDAGRRQTRCEWARDKEVSHPS